MIYMYKINVWVYVFLVRERVRERERERELNKGCYIKLEHNNTTRVGSRREIEKEIKKEKDGWMERGRRRRERERRYMVQHGLYLFDPLLFKRRNKGASKRRER